MVGSRNSTVYDFTNLRLHPDGTRVKLKATEIARPRTAKYSTRDSRGNWIAQDAGGLGNVPKRRKLADSSDEEAEGEEEVRDEAQKILTKAAVKRQRFAEDLSFLDIPDPSSSTPTTTEDSNTLPLPSSASHQDLLKCVHRLAASYYGERGQLLNSYSQYRKEKRARKKRRDMQAASGSSVQEPADDEASSSSDEEEEPIDSNAHRDMYKTMNGSALMAIGMLVQEHMAMLIRQGRPVDEELSETEADSESQEIETEGPQDAAPEPEPAAIEYEDDVSLASDDDSNS
ncbi:hypothetical protein C8J56DRAFT_1157277 [Mycena floridula]|nr:hypothetical protein C8J56DRAFT_1157277 [Mycena floridula]